MECVGSVFRVTCVGSGGGERSSLVGVEDNDNGISDVCAYEDKGVDAATMVECVCKEVGTDGVSLR